MSDEVNDVTSTAYLKDTFKIGYDAFEQSRLESTEVTNLYHNRHYTVEQLAVLSNRGQPAETFNVVKLFSRMLLGYYSTVINTIQANPVRPEDIVTAAVLNDVISNVLRTSNFSAEGEKVKLSGLLSGLMCVYLDVVPTGEKDQYGRPIYTITVEHVPEAEIVLDPMSRKDDYSDARYIHRFKWVSEEQVEALFGEAKEEELVEYYNHTQQKDAAYDATGRGQEVGLYKVHNNYLIVHSIVTDRKGKTWSIFWNDDVILKKTEITHKEVKFPYRVTKVHTSNNAEFYGIFREVIETQKAINQALLKLQLMVNTQKAFVQDGAVENLAEFTEAFNRVSAVIPVVDLAGIKLESLSREVLDQYNVIDKGLDRIQRVLNVNDSFLGLAYASDSGRKVKLQQNATVVGLRYLTGRIEAFYRYIGWDIAKLIQQYYTAHQVLRITDEASGDRWIELNKPMETFTGQLHPETGEPVMQVEFEEALDPASHEPLVDDEGNRVVAPIPEEATELAYTKVEIEIHANNYNDEDEKNQLMLEQVLAGSVGQLLAQVNPAGFFKATSLSMKSMSTKNSPEIAAILEQTAQQLSPEQQQQVSEAAAGMGQMGGGASSRTLNLPPQANN